MTPLQERFKEAIGLNVKAETSPIGWFICIDGKEDAAIACEKIADEFAEEFAMWIYDNVLRTRYGYHYNGKNKNSFRITPTILRRKKMKIEVEHYFQQFKNEAKQK